VPAGLYEQFSGGGARGSNGVAAREGERGQRSRGEVAVAAQLTSTKQNHGETVQDRGRWYAAKYESSMTVTDSCR
jgi:hypothetical protein